MSTSLHDLPAAAVVAAALPPTEITADDEGTGVDLSAGDGPCFAVLQVGAVSGMTPTLLGQLEESADNATWSPIADGVFAEVAAANQVQVLRFTRSARYVRWTCVVTGNQPSFLGSVLVGQQRKVM